MKKKQKAPEVERLPLPVLEADPQQGLSAQQVQQRVSCGWSNDTGSGASCSERELILRNVLTFFNLVFVVLAVVLLIGGSSPKNMTFLVVVVCNTAIGCYQQIKAKRTLDKLNLVAAQMVKTVRDGKKTEIRWDLLVRDDIVEFSIGDQICADAVVREGLLYVNESLITGEADAVVKRPGDDLLSGSFVIAGSARAQLTRVGPEAFAAQLAAEAKANPRASKSEMMRTLDKLIQVVGIALIPVGLILFYQEYHVLKLGLTTSVEGTVAALVGMIPEGLYLLTSVAMAVSSMKLAKDRVLVQDMNCIETLARVDVLCVDKTGTITEPAMSVEELVPLGSHAEGELREILKALYPKAEGQNETGQAMAQAFGGTTDWVCTRHIPFNTEVKWGGGVFRDRGAYLVGAPELLLEGSHEEALDQAEQWQAQGYRVLLVVRYDGDPQPHALEADKTEPLALVLLTNRIREEAAATFAYFKEQGVSIRVISGDNPVTVSNIAAQAGIDDADRYVDVSELETEADFDEAVQKYVVFGRVTPEKKKQLVFALKRAKHTVAMTGDGVNDVLAMKAADCGIAMASGATAASQVAQLVLLDSDFSAMPGIVNEGRRVINNIQRTATLFLVKNIVSLLLSLMNLVLGWPYPFIPIHMTLISAATIGIPAFLLAMEPNYERVGGRFLPTVLRRALPGGLANVLSVLLAQTYMVVFKLPMEEISVVCTEVMAVVGMMVLYRVCQPFDRFRKLIWAGMAGILVACFTLLDAVFELHVAHPGIFLLMVTLIVVAPAVYRSLSWLFDQMEKLYRAAQEKIRSRKQRA